VKVIPMVRVGSLKRLQSDLERVMDLKKQSLIDQAIDALGGKWPSDDLMSIHLHQGTPMVGYVASRWLHVKGLRFICIRPEFKLRKAERQKKPSWKDAPDWAQWLAQDCSGQWRFHTAKPQLIPSSFIAPESFHAVAGRSIRSTSGEVIGDWRDTLEQRPTNSTCVADGLREIREAFTDWGIHLAGAQVAHKGTTPNGMHKLEVTMGGSHIIDFYEKFEPKLADLVDWYDYTNQKALRLPPVGVECQYALNGSSMFWGCEVISHHNIVIRCPHLVGDDGMGLQVVKYGSIEFRPLDWDRNQQPKPDPSPELSFHLSNAFNELQAGARLLPENDARKQVLVSLASGVGAVREGL